MYSKSQEICCVKSRLDIRRNGISFWGMVYDAQKGNLGNLRHHFWSDCIKKARDLNLTRQNSNKIINVGVDIWNYILVNIEEIKKIILFVA